MLASLPPAAATSTETSTPAAVAPSSAAGAGAGAGAAFFAPFFFFGMLLRWAPARGAAPEELRLAS